MDLDIEFILGDKIKQLLSILLEFLPRIDVVVQPRSQDLDVLECELSNRERRNSS